MSLKIALRPESAYILWCGCWVVAGAAMLWRHRAALRRDTDGRTGWSAEPPTIAVHFGVYIGAYLALGGLGMGLARELVRFLPAADKLDLALGLLFMQAFLTGALLLIRRHLPEFSPARPHRVSPAGPFGFTPAGILHGFAGAMTLVGLTALGWTLFLEKTGLKPQAELQDGVKLLAQTTSPLVFVAFALGAAVFAPMHEELVYRSGVFAAMRARLPRFAAYAASGLFFAAIHFNLNALLPLAILGAWLAWLYDTTADLRVPITIHALFNANTVLWAFLAPGAIV